MNKLKLLVTASLLVGGGIFALSAADGVTSANAETVGESVVGDKLATDIISGEKYIIRTLGMSNEAGGEYAYMTSKVSGKDYFGFSDNIKNSLVFTFDYVSEKDKYTISFEENGITAYLKSATGSSNNLYVEYDDSVSIPDSCYWSVSFESDGSATIKYDGSISRVISFNDNKNQGRFSTYKSNQSSIALLPLISMTTHNVEFYDGDNLLFSKSVIDGETINFDSIDSYKYGYIFDGWYIDTELTKLFDKETIIVSDIKLYAKYIDASPSDFFEMSKTKTSLKATNEARDYLKEIKFYSSPIAGKGTAGLLDSNVNNAYNFGLDASKWSVNVIEGKPSLGYPASDNPSETKDTELRIYGSNKIKFVYTGSEKIDNITLRTTNVTNLKISIDGTTKIVGNKIQDNTYMYAIGANTFIIENTSSKRIDCIDGIDFNLAENIITSVSLRFGASIPMNKFIKEASYGVIIADGTKIEDGDDLNSLFAESNTTSASDYVAYLKQQGINVYQEPFADTEIAYVSTPNSSIALDETDPNAKYAQYALVIDGLLEHMNQTFAAVCYMEYEGQLYLMKEARHSINSVVDAYLADEDTMSTLTDNSVAILNALNAM